MFSTMRLHMYVCIEVENEWKWHFSWDLENYNIQAVTPAVYFLT